MVKNNNKINNNSSNSLVFGRPQTKIKTSLSPATAWNQQGNFEVPKMEDFSFDMKILIKTSASVPL